MINRRDIFKGLLGGIILAGTASGAVAKILETNTVTKPTWEKINKRKVILDIQKAMEDSMGNTLFGFNDSNTRRMVSEHVRSVAENHKLSRNLMDYQIVCNDMNNSSATIDKNELHCDVYLKFGNAITFTHLNAVASRGGMTFEEVVGNFG